MENGWFWHSPDIPRRVFSSVSASVSFPDLSSNVVESEPAQCGNALSLSMVHQVPTFPHQLSCVASGDEMAGDKPPARDKLR